MKRIYQLPQWVIASVYVILQELKIHNLGDANTYDINDVIFSVLGSMTAYFVLVRIDPKIIVD